ncbi:MAG TPA: Smr/MutS family protein [Vicinamibacterales bacterium]|jgi:DNA mismatch repair protein MutS2|nr:Smr/MutS family protein [Vicinamibacterales bacterium]
MHAGALRALEFDRIVAVVAGLSVTPTGQDRLAELEPLIDASAVARTQRATTEGTRFLADHPGFPLRAPSDLDAIIAALGVEGRALEPLRLVGLADYLESIEQTRAAVRGVAPSFPLLTALVDTVASFRSEIADVRRKIEPSGDVADNASPALASIRERLRRQKSRLRSTLDSFLRGRETSKYLQEQVVTDRNGRHVLMVRAEHRGAIPGIVHGGSASGASLFVEPMETVEINNEIVELEEQEAEEVRRILLELTDAFRGRPDDLTRTLGVATELDVIQARARFSLMTDAVEPVIAADGSFELRGARHPLLMRRVNERLEDGREDGGIDPVPVDILLTPPTRVLVITGPNTGGKTVALKTAGLLSLMAQSGLHIPADKGSKLPVFGSVFADIGDEQSISASLSTFSAHITNVVSMDRTLTLPTLILLDEVGAGTDPVEGGALGTAVIDHFRRRGAHLIATTHYDSLKSYASTTDGVVSAAFGFNPENFAPTYKLIYGSPGRSLAIEIAARLGMPADVVAAARENLTEREKQLAEHLARVDDDLRALERERKQATAERLAVADAERKLRAREAAVRDREETFRKRLDSRLEEQVRAARKEIDTVIEGLKARAAELSQQASVRLRSGDKTRVAGISTGETGAVRADARAALDDVVSRLKVGAGVGPSQGPSQQAEGEIEVGSRVTVGALGLEGVVVELHGKHAEIDMRGKRLRAPLRDLRIAGSAADSAERNAVHRIRVNVDLVPRTGSLSELNVIGNTVDEALTRLEKFLDEAMTTDLRELRIVHGHGTGQLRRAIGAFLKEHPLVANISTAPQNQGGGGATIVELKD